MAGAADLNLRLSFWFLNHRDQLRKWWVMSLIGLDVLLVVAWVVGAMVYRTDGGFLTRQAAAHVGTPLFQSPARAELAEPLNVSSTQALTVDAGHVTLATAVENVNEQYGVATLRYRFTYGETQLPVRETFLLPKSQRFLAEPNVVRLKGTVAPGFEVVSVSWQRVRTPDLLTPASFSTKDVVFDAAAMTTSVPPRPAPRLSAILVNNSVYSFRTAEVSIGLLDTAGQLQQVESTTLKNWQTFSEQSFTVQWISAIPPNVKIVIVPQVNIFDSTVFLRP